MELLDSKLAYEGYGVDVEIIRLPLAELDQTLPRIRDASTLIALMALRHRLTASTT